MRLYDGGIMSGRYHKIKTRAELYGQEAKSLLRDITMYRALTEERVLRR